MSGDQKPPSVPGKSAPVTSHNKVSLSELIAKTPGAQTREQLLERIEARQKKRSKEPQKPAPSEEDLSKPEPMNIINDPYGSAADVLQRINANAKAIRNAKQREELKAQSKPPKGSKPRVVVNNDNPKPSDKK
jgi:hypothetical protein